MLRPERMSKISVTGAKSVMPQVIETVHDLNLVHLSDYDGSWEGFANGEPLSGAEEASQRLVTIRSLEKTLGMRDDESYPSVHFTEEELDTRLAEAREAITSLEDRIQAAHEQRRTLSDEIEHLEPFATLGLDLDLYHGYDRIDVAIGEGSSEAIEASLAEADAVHGFETFSADGVVAIFADPGPDSSDVIEDALVGVEFSAVSIPDATGDPSDQISTLHEEHAEIDAHIDSLEDELVDLRDEYAGFLRTAERELSIVVDQTEAPLRFATTAHAFIAEGWIPTSEYHTLVDRLAETVGDSVDIEELESAAYDGHSSHHHEEEDVVADGGTDGEAITMDDDPPVVLDNPQAAKPFELLTNMVNRPKYGELDPTLAVFITFPIAFGFMIGDIGYGVLYILMGWYLLANYDSKAFTAVGMIAVWSGAFTVLFGWLFDDTFGVHILDYDIAVIQSLEFLGLGVLSKGIQSPDWLMTWIIVSLMFGWLHLNIGLVIRFINELNHGWKPAIMEAGSWILAMNGFIIWLFSHSEATMGPLPTGSITDLDLTAASAKPTEFFGPESVLAGTGFEGFPEIFGLLGLLSLFLGVGMVTKAEGVAGFAETPAWVLGHFLSYLRIVAVLLGKGAMAFVVNLIVFGAYISEAGPYEGYVFFNLPGGDPATAAGVEVGQIDIAFEGIWNIDPLLIPVAILIFIVGHIIVLLLGITAAGIQMLRLEYVEFFQKFFEGGGREFDAFGPDPEP